MADWYRNEHWDETIAAGFEQRLARARDQSQYLVLQGYTLLFTHPKVAATLFQRAVESNDPQITARALLYLGTALAVDGDLDGAIVALDRAMAEEARNPLVRTGAYLDHALLVALARRTELYEVALSRLEAEAAMPPSELDLSTLIIFALIRSAQHSDGSAYAREALGVLDAIELDGGELPPFLAPATIRKRLEVCL